MPARNRSSAISELRGMMRDQKIDAKVRLKAALAVLECEGRRRPRSNGQASRELRVLADQVLPKSDE